MGEGKIVFPKHVRASGVVVVMDQSWMIGVEMAYRSPVMVDVDNSDVTGINDNTDHLSSINGINTLGDILLPILRHDDLARFRDVVYAYLRLPAECWRALQQLRESQTAYNILHWHWNLWDNVPQTLWDSVVRVRDDEYFERVQTELVRVFDDHISFLAPTKEIHSRSQSLTSWNGGLNPTFGPGTQVLLQPCRRPSSHGNGIRLPTFATELPRQTQTPTHSMAPSIVYASSRSNSRSPWRHKKGKAPPGQVYVCPLPNCTKKGFRNVGNYINHMLKHHRDYPRHDPETSLQVETPEAAVAVEGSDDLISPAATTASSSPLHVRHLSQDWSAVGEIVSTNEQDDVHPPVKHESSFSRGDGSGGVEEHGRTLSFSSDGVPGNDGERLWRTNPQSSSSQDSEVRMEEQEKGRELSHTNGGSWTFGMFQASLLGGG